MRERRARIVDWINKWARDHGGPPRVSDWRQVRNPEWIRLNGFGWPSYNTCIRYSPDGTWDGIIREAGFEPRGRGRPRFDAS